MLVRLNGCRLRAFSPAHRDGRGWSVDYDDCVLDPGEIVWSGGMTLSIR